MDRRQPPRIAVCWRRAQRRGLRRVVDTTTQRFGRLDVLVNDTGGPPIGGANAIDDAGWVDAFELAFQSAVRLTRHALPLLRRNGRGRIVTVTSCLAAEPDPGLVL